MDGHTPSPAALTHGQALLDALQTQRNQALNQVAELLALVRVLESDLARLRKLTAPELPIEPNGKAA